MTQREIEKLRAEVAAWLEAATPEQKWWWYTNCGRSLWWNIYTPDGYEEQNPTIEISAEELEELRGGVAKTMNGRFRGIVSEDA